MRKIHGGRMVGWGLTVSLSVALWATAQELPVSRNIPGTVPKVPPAAAPAAAVPMGAPAVRRALRVVGHPGRKTLQKIVFTPHPRAPKPGEEPVTTGGVALLEKAPALVKKLEVKYVGKAMTQDTAGEIAQATLEHYQAHERPIVFVQPLEVNYHTGVITVGVLESLLENVRGEGAEWFDNDRLARQIRVQPGGYIDREQLLNDLAWINEINFLKSNIMLEPGSQPGTTAIRLQTKDRFPGRIFAGVENTGTRQSGEWRWLAGANWATDALGFYQQFSYQFSAAFDDLQRQPVHAVTWEGLLPWRHRLSIYGSWAGSDLDLSRQLGVRSLSYEGEQWQISPRYTVPIGKLYGPFEQSVSFGFDWKRSNLEYRQDGFSIPTNETDVIQAAISYEARRQDSAGESRFSVDGYWSPGGIGDRNVGAAYREVDPRLQPDYVYGILRAGRVQNLPKGFTADLQFAGHLASTTLPSSEQLAIGGYGTVRGYQERVLFGDSGLIVNLELRTPPISLGQHLGWARLQDQTQLLAFFDLGLVSADDPLPGDAKRETLASVGVGMRQRVGQNFSVRADLGFPLIDPDLGFKVEPRASLGVILSY